MDKLDKSLNFAWNTEVESAYIITIKDHELSERMSARCAKSCDKAGMPWKKWETFDGTKGEIIVPDHLKDKSWLKWIKVVNPALAKSEVAMILGHISLWAHCVELDRPIVVLEHDGVFLQKYTHHSAINTIVYLGCEEQVRNNFYSNPIAIMGQLNENYRFILRTHAYSIDPMVARRLLGDMILSGIHTGIDVGIRSDIYCQVQMGIYAFDMADGQSTSWDKDDKKKDEGLMRIHNKLVCA
jgi:hypothetical protein